MNGVKLIGAPTSVGTGTAGCEYGPRAVENTLQNYEFVMLDREDRREDTGDMKHFNDVMAWCGLINKEVTRTFSEGKMPGLIGGDHSLAIGSISAVSVHAKKNIHVLWFDAHADINTPQTSPSGNMHGMPVQMLIRLGYLRPDQITYFGLRSVDPGEVQFMQEHGIIGFSSDDCKHLTDFVKSTCATIDPSTHVHVSFDMDFFDPSVASGVGTPETGGPTDTSLKWLRSIPRIDSFDVVELNPELDTSGATTELACRVVQELSRKR